MKQRVLRVGLRAGFVASVLTVAGCSGGGGESEVLATAQEALTRGVPYRVRALDYTAFQDSDTVHEGNCGSGPVDAETTTDPNGGTCDVGYTKAGEWLEYSIQVASAGKFNIISRVASATTGRTFHLSIDGTTVGGSQTVPNAGWQAFADRTLSNVSLTAGTHTLRVTFETGDTNLNYIDITPGTATLPARIEAEDYQRAFESTLASNSGGACDRGDGVDKETTGDTAGGGCDVGWTTAGEWLEYDVNAPQTGLFDLTARLGSGVTGRTIQIYIDGNSVGTLSSPSTGWATFEDRKLENINLSAGAHVVRVLFVQGDTNLNYLNITAHGVLANSPVDSFGAAANYNVFLFQDLSSTPTIAGPVAAGRDISAQSFGYNTSNTGAIGVLVGRNFTGTSGSVYRDLVYGNTLSLTNVGVIQGVSRKATPVDFTAEKGRLSSLSAELASVPSNGTTTVYPNATVDFAGSDPLHNVFSVDGAALVPSDVLRFLVPSTSTVVVNVTGSGAVFDTTGMQLGGVTPGHLVWNFPQANTVRLAQTGFKGTLLAVNAAVTQSSSTLDGVLIASSLVGGDNGLTWQPFNGELPLTTDSDCDGMPDYLEQAFGLNPNDPSDKKGDLDADGIPNWEELRFGGDPRKADTDGDGLRDDPDLLAGRDLDGDSFPYQSDNCPSDVNQDQADRDGDGVGDACDSTPLGGALQFSQVTIQVARQAASGHYALLDATSEQSDRRIGDQKGLIPSGVTFRLIRDTFSGGQAINEYFNATTGAHAYAVSSAEGSSLTANGFRSLGVVGYSSVAAFGFGQSVAVRRFAKGAGTALEHALTTDSAQATQLLAAGFGETSALGFALVDSGHLRRPKSVVRYRSSAGTTLHSVSRAGDLPLTNLTSEGLQFRVLAEKNGWSVPLVRLRNSSGAEALSTDSTEVGALQSQGYKVDGVLGHIFQSAVGDTAESLVSLVRLKKGTAYAESVDLTEIQALKASGFVDDRVLGRAIRMPAARANGHQCKGQTPPLVRVVQHLGPESTPIRQNVAVLYALNSACTIRRVVGGSAVNPTEVLIAQLLAADPEQKRQLIEHSNDILSSTAADRATALGPLAKLDPGACAAPVDYKGSDDSVRIVTRGLDPAGQSSVNGGTTGGPEPVSFARLRAPQCQGGVNYDPALATTPGAASRAITADPNQHVLGAGTEVHSDTLVGEIKPRLYGVLRTPPNSPLDAVNQYSDFHPNVQMPLIGIDVGPCSSACTQSAGEACVANRCRAYPVIPKGSTVDFSGSNLWDVRTAAIRLKEFGGAGLVFGDIPADINILPPQGEDLALRCNPEAVDYTPAISPPIPPDPNCVSTLSQPCLDPDQNKVLPTETWLERAEVTINADSGKFFQVQMVNHNGAYFRIGDKVAVTPDQIPLLGRTVHVCTPPACTPSPDPVVSACTQGLLPSCGGTAGGVWNTPPRPLEYCRSIDPLGTNNACPETPAEFVSDATVSDAITTLPLLVFVAPPAQTKFIQTRLIGLQCFDETGWDAAGDDELVIHAATNPVVTGNDDIADLQSAFGTYKTDINSGDTRTSEIMLTSTAAHLFDPTEQPVMLEWGEDDDVSFGNILIGTIAAVGTGFAVAGSGGTVLAIGVAAGAAGGGSFIGSVLAQLPDPDDFLGRAAYQCSTNDLISRSTQTHDGVIAPVATLQAIDGSSEVNALEASSHPAVDLRSYGKNSDLINQSCAVSSACSSGKTCQLGACVPTNWVVDRSLPVQFDPTQDLGGTIERRDYVGSGAQYRGYVSTSISGKDIKKSP